MRQERLVKYWKALNGSENPELVSHRNGELLKILLKKGTFNSAFGWIILVPVQKAHFGETTSKAGNEVGIQIKIRSKLQQ